MTIKSHISGALIRDFKKGAGIVKLGTTKTPYRNQLCAGCLIEWMFI